MHFFHANPFMPEMDVSPRDRSLCPRKFLAILSHFFFMEQRVAVKVTAGPALYSRNVTTTLSRSFAKLNYSGGGQGRVFFMGSSDIQEDAE